MKRTRYIMVEATFPTHQREEVTAKYQEMEKKYPLDSSLGTLLVHMAQRTLGGYRAISIAEPQEGKFSEFYQYISDYYYEFDVIEGYEAVFETGTKIEIA